jgi:hypothetical protein
MFNANSNGKSVYRLGAIAAIGAVGVGITEILITFMPGGNTPHQTVLDWLAFYQQNAFMGLRDLGLLNIFFDLLAILIYFALYTAHKNTPAQPFAALVMGLAFLGVGVFLATNRAFPMLAVSQQYAAATTAAQRATLEAAAQSLLSVGQSHTPGTFLGFFLIELAGVLISLVMLRGKIFGKATAYTGLFGFGMLLVFEFFASFYAGVSALAMVLAMVGGILSMAWNILVARRLLRLPA